MAKIFKSHGKLMITGEYFVLRGAKSLLLPTKFYQDMIVSRLDDKAIISWESYDHNHKKWFSVEFNLPYITIVGEKTEQKVFLKKILDFVIKKKPKILIAGCGTGQQIARKTFYKDATILAVDLSLSSLALAKRKMQEFNSKNIEFLHSDLLNLKKIN